jgi:hypothetical protein
MTEALCYILSTVQALKLSHNADSRYVSPITDSQTVQTQICTETQVEHGERFDQDISTMEWAVYLIRYSDWLRAGRSGDRIPVGATDRPWGPPNGYRVFPGGKAAGAWC